jgi:SAM-dependent methyltransferase
MQAYGKSFAKIYNLRWNPFSDTLFPRFQEFFERRAPRHKTLLDLCCGTGRLAWNFLEAGWKVVGVDLSPEMLEYARTNSRNHIEAGNAEFILGDARNFALKRRVQFAVSTYDALNHLEDTAQLASCFDCVHRALREDGVFIFDLNTPFGLNNWNNVNVTDRDELFLMNRSLYDEASGRATTRISGFLKLENGFYERFEETVFNTAFPNDLVHTLLLRAGFKRVTFSRLQTLGAPAEDADREVRIFVVAEK